MRAAIKLFGTFGNVEKGVTALWVTFPLSSIDYIMHKPEGDRVAVVLKNGLCFEAMLLNGMDSTPFKRTNAFELDSLIASGND